MNQGLTALAHRDQALAELDRGDAGRARAIASDALVLLETAGQGESLDAAALLVALAETDECLGHFDLARVAAGRAAAILAVAFDPEDHGGCWLWCQAEERLAGLDRVGGDLDGAAARLLDLIDRAVRILGPVSEAVVSAENALGVVYKYAGHFDDAAAAYGRALRALTESGRRDPLAEACLCHNLGGPALRLLQTTLSCNQLRCLADHREVHRDSRRHRHGGRAIAARSGRRPHRSGPSAHRSGPSACRRSRRHAWRA